jgi:hypothetical protein
MASSSDLEHHKLTKFFFTISIFITGVSVLAVYSTIMGTEYSIKKDDIQAESVTQSNLQIGGATIKHIN